jgi:CPA2 family monovalent cation:H+ antiporter-2
VLSASQVRDGDEVIRLARELNPQIRVLARSNYLRELPSLLRAGASSAFAGEVEVALALTESILREHGATPEQIERERERVREELAPPR